MNCEMKNYRAPLCILHIASITQYYCKICHYTNQIGRSNTSSHCRPGFKARHSWTTLCDTLSWTIFRLPGLKVLLNALGSCSALNNPSQLVENLSISTLSFRMRNRILDSARQNQNFRVEKLPVALICFVADHARSSPRGKLCRNIKEIFIFSSFFFFFFCFCLGLVGLLP